MTTEQKIELHIASILIALVVLALVSTTPTNIPFVANMVKILVAIQAAVATIKLITVIVEGLNKEK